METEEITIEDIIERQCLKEILTIIEDYYGIRRENHEEVQNQTGQHSRQSGEGGLCH